MSQFLLRSADADVERYLKLFTFVPTPDVEKIMNEHNIDPGKRKAQHLLASEVLELVHGREEAEKTRTEHQTMRSPNLASLTGRARTQQDQGQGLQSDGTEDRIVLRKSQVLDTPISRVLLHAGLASSKSEGARMVAKAGVYVASRTLGHENQELHFVQAKDQNVQNAAELLVDELLILRIGKWKVRVIEVIDDGDMEVQDGGSPS